MSDTPRAPIEFRAATVAGVNFTERVVEIIVVPYDEEALVEYRGELWEESFAPGAFNGVETRPDRLEVRANRDHNRSRTVGKALRHHPSRADGLVSEIRIAPTDLGDETLTLLAEDMLSASAGFGVNGSWQVLNRPKRRINKAYLDHIAFVEQPAYAGARVLSVRSGEGQSEAADLSPLHTPNLDEVLAWMDTRRRA